MRASVCCMCVCRCVCVRVRERDRGGTDGARGTNVVDGRKEKKSFSCLNVKL